MELPCPLQLAALIGKFVPHQLNQEHKNVARGNCPVLQGARVFKDLSVRSFLAARYLSQITLQEHFGTNCLIFRNVKIDTGHF